MVMSNNKYFNTIFKDHDILVIDKFSGIETIRGVSNEISIEQLIKNNIERSGIVHRLDKDTSGVMVIAKTQQSFENLKKQFVDHSVKKIYITLVSGDCNDKGEIISYIVHDPKRKQAMKAINYPTGLERGKPREAQTLYKKIKKIKIGDNVASFLEVEIKTGRTHQIRVHMQSIGHPVLGDEMYNTKTSKEFSKKIGLKRQFLHAKILELNHPKTENRMKFESPLPNDLKLSIL